MAVRQTAESKGVMVVWCRWSIDWYAQAEQRQVDTVWNVITEEYASKLCVVGDYLLITIFDDYTVVNLEGLTAGIGWTYDGEV
jgi:hypothetical protein